MTHLYALGLTEHTIGTQNIRSMAMIQLLLGNMGMPGGGINALRGHSNVQGTTDMAYCRCLYQVICVYQMTKIALTNNTLMRLRQKISYRTK